MNGIKPRVGLIGVGNMGMGMALNLLGKGYAVSVRDSDAGCEARAAQAGAQVTSSPAALASQCEVLIIAVVNAEQTESVLRGAQGVIHAPALPRCVMLCPTIAPQDVERFAARLADAGIATIDAPMSGGPVRAREGTMSLMVACEDAVYTTYQVLLHDLAAHVFRISARVGDGARTKLVNNLLASINLAGAAECLALADKLGLDMRKTLEVIEASSGQSWIGSERMSRALAGDTSVRAHMSLLAKDSALAIDAGERIAFESRIGGVATQVFRDACKRGLMQADDSALLKFYQAASSIKN